MRARLVLLLIITVISAAPNIVLAQRQTLIVAPDGRYSTIAAALADAQSGDVIEVRGGVYSAPLSIDESVSLVGVDHPVIDGQGSGSLVLINAPDVVFQGFTLRNSGRNLEREDTAVVVQAARVTVAENTLENVLFGIYFAQAPDGIARNNVIHCIPLEPGVRGDGLRVWYSNQVTLSENRVDNCRDMLFWYSNGLTIENNVIRNSRYGLHFMYNNDARVMGNTLDSSAVGSYMMYTNVLTFERNIITNNRGASGYGIALKDTDHAVIRDNWIAGNQTGIYIDNSPSVPDHENLFTNNVIAENDIGITALPAVSHNRFSGNAFVENTEQASTAGRGNLQGNGWSQDGQGNYWSDYAGYDANEDGIGDMPYRSEKLFESLTNIYPVLRLFARSPATQALDFAGAAFPSLRPDPKLIDDAPMTTLQLPDVTLPQRETASLPLLVISLALIGAGGVVSLFALRFALPRQRG